MNPTSNELPDSFTPLIDLAADMIDGATEHPEVEIKQWTAAQLTLLRDAAIAKKAAHKTAVKAEEAVTGARKTANSNAKGFIATAQRMLVDDLGTKPNTEWEDAGWPSGTIAAPGTIEGRKKLFDKLVPWLNANPGKEVPNKQFTYAAGSAILTALGSALNDLPKKVGDRVKALGADVTAEKALRKGMSGLSGELGSLLDDDAPEWYYFGLVPPANPEPPAPAENLAAHAAGPTTIVAGCDRSPRGQKYIFLRQIVGTDAAPVALPAMHDPAITIENLPAGATVKISVQATNGAGKSAVTGPVAVTLG
jgi:hypothetical protein